MPSQRGAVAQHQDRFGASVSSLERRRPAARLWRGAAWLLALCGGLTAQAACRPQPRGASSAQQQPPPGYTPAPAGQPGYYPQQPPAGAQPAPTGSQPLLANPPPPPQDPLALSGSAYIEDERNTIAVFQKAAPATVFVTQRRVVFDPSSMRALDIPAGSGSGFIWDRKGHVVTNFHVIRGARSLQVQLFDQKTYEARVVGAEPRKDIAVLHIQAPTSSLTPLELPPEKQPIVVGQKAIAIGNPFGLDHTLTTGIVSALERPVEGVGGVTIRDMIQTDAAINPGNSGGPLLDSAGRLIGMNTIILSSSGSSAGIGFAVPVSTIRRIVPQLIEHGRTVQVGLGVNIDPRQRLEQRYRIRGVIVLAVPPGSPAERAGIRGVTTRPDGIELGDVIVGIGGEPVNDYDDLYNELDGRKAGDRVKVDLVRGSQTRSVEVELAQLE